MIGALAARAAWLKASRPSAAKCGLAAVALALSGVIAILPVSVSVALVIGGALALLVFLRPVVGLAVLAIAVPFGSFVEVPLSGMSIGAVEPIVGVLLLGYLARLLSRREPLLWLPRVLWPALGFLAVLTFELTLASSLSLALKEFLRWSELVVVMIVAANVVRTRAHIVGLVAALLAAGLLEALVGWAQFLLGIGPPAFALGRFLRAYGTFSQPNPFAGYLGLVWPLALSLAVYWLLIARRHRAALGLHERSSGLLRTTSRVSGTALRNVRLTFAIPDWLGTLAVLATIVIGVAALMSFSRGAWLGFMLAALLVAGLYRRKLFALLLLAGALLVAMVMLAQFNLLPATIAARLGDAFAYFRIFDASSVQATASNWAVVERMASWQAAWRMFDANPIFGVGLGHYNAVYARYALSAWPQPLGHAHNFYLNVLAEMGAIGLAAYLVMVGAWFTAAIACLRRFARSRDAFERWVVVGLVAALACTTLHNVFDNLYVHGMNVQVGLLLGMMLAVTKTASFRKPLPLEG